jgi:hypothetical protein
MNWCEKLTFFPLWANFCKYDIFSTVGRVMFSLRRRVYNIEPFHSLHDTLLVAGGLCFITCIIIRCFKTSVPTVFSTKISRPKNLLSDKSAKFSRKNCTLKKNCCVIFLPLFFGRYFFGRFQLADFFGPTSWMTNFYLEGRKIKGS